MPGLPIFFLPIVLGIFNLQVNWSSAARDGVNIIAAGEDQFINQCLEKGLQVSFRFKTRICKRRSLWFDDCEDERIDTRAVEFDPISQRYEIAIDTHHDAEGPKKVRYADRESALEVASVMRAVPISKLPRTRAEYLDPYKNYLGIRTITECKGEGRYFGQIPLILSLGLINTAVKDSGWIAFDLSSGTIINP